MTEQPQQHNSMLRKHPIASIFSDQYFQHLIEEQLLQETPRQDTKDEVL